MEDLWRVREVRIDLDDPADRAEYDRLLKCFHEEEQRNNLKQILFEQNPFRPSADEKE